MIDRMHKIPPFVDGAIFGLLFLPMAFFLKLICPLSEGCFVDPFFVLLFSPLFMLQSIFDKVGFALSTREEIVFISVFWSVAWAFLAHLGSKVLRTQYARMEE